jgi:NitT/TauT family transport system substrate-binding protein
MTFRVFGLPVIAVAAGLVLVAGCASRPPAVSSGLEKTSLVVDVFPTVDTAGLYIAQMNGLFARQGLHVTIKFTSTSQQAVNAQVAGQADVTSADYVTYVDNEVTGRARLRIVAEASFLQPHVLALMVSPHSTIGTVAELKGKSIALAAPDDIGGLLVDSLLAGNGLSPHQVRFRTGIALPTTGKALDEGTVDAAPVPEPFTSSSEEAYGDQPLADLDQGATESFPIQGYAVTEAWARQHPHTLQAFDRALEQGQELADTNRADIERAMNNYLGIPYQTAAIMALPDFPLSVDPVRLQRVVDAMNAFGLLPAKDHSFRVSTMTG